MWFQEFVHECIDLQEHIQQLEKDKDTLKVMQQKLNELVRLPNYTSSKTENIKTSSTLY